MHGFFGLVCQCHKTGSSSAISLCYCRWINQSDQLILFCNHKSNGVYVRRSKWTGQSQCNVWFSWNFVYDSSHPGLCQRLGGEFRFDILDYIHSAFVCQVTDTVLPGTVFYMSGGIAFVSILMSIYLIIDLRGNRFHEITMAQNKNGLLNRNPFIINYSLTTL